MFLEPSAPQFLSRVTRTEVGGAVPACDVTARVTGFQSCGQGLTSQLRLVDPGGHLYDGVLRLRPFDQQEAGHLRVHVADHSLLFRLPC